MASAPMDQDKYIDSAVRAVTNKRPVPEIDFTLHTMEDGTQVSTLDRVCKGKLPLYPELHRESEAWPIYHCIAEQS